MLSFMLNKKYISLANILSYVKYCQGIIHFLWDPMCVPL